jgi:hypothetical protein
MTWVAWILFYGYLGWQIGFLVLRSASVSVLPALVTIVVILFGSRFVSITNYGYGVLGWSILIVAILVLLMASLLKPSVAKIVLATLLIPVVVIWGVGLLFSTFVLPLFP